ncbi:MAG: hypothetical protein D6798_12170 [Deltaproteobacteria bacterium]|nr:MAG: hypothetical protein D6798_12170 [Deltaproteobacteria bacterium]
MAAATPAGATTVAVLPLTRGAASEEYDGLGQALAGMLISDLSATPGLVMVERDRLDALLSEIALSDQGFLDPATAQQLGRGLGAEVILTGSYSVVADRFLLDARLVRVESGEILDAADAQGSVTDFVAVEKLLVEELLDELDVTLSLGDRRRLMLQAPTEDFAAFASWGEGLARRQQGDLDAARAAFERALARDPRFAEARAALAELQGLIEAARAEQRLVADAWLDSRFRAVLDATVDERLRPAGFVHDADSLAAFALRQSVLHDAGLHCRRAAELEAFLDHVGWDVSVPDASPTVGHRLHALRAAYELDGRDCFAARQRAGLTDRPADLGLLSSTTELVLHQRSRSLGREGAGLVDSLLRCLPEPRWEPEIERLAARAAAAGQSRRVDGPIGLTLGDQLDLVWAWLHARRVGADDALTARTRALLEAERAPMAQDMLMARLDAIAREADLTAAYEAGRLGQDPAELEAVMRALADGDPDVLALDDPTCAWAATTMSGTARGWVTGLSQDRAQPPGEPRLQALRRRFQSAGMVYGPLRDLGCIADTPGRFSSWDELTAAMERVTLLAEAEERELCVQLQATLERTLEQPPATIASLDRVPELKASLSWGVLTTWYAMVTQRCVALPRR